jgi:hypothetical protein
LGREGSGEKLGSIGLGDGRRVDYVAESQDGAGGSEGQMHLVLGVDVCFEQVMV